jgi:hypothetical protein
MSSLDVKANYMDKHTVAESFCFLQFQWDVYGLMLKEIVQLCAQDLVKTKLKFPSFMDIYGSRKWLMVCMRWEDRLKPFLQSPFSPFPWSLIIGP